MNPTVEQQKEKLQNLINTASTPKQKAQYQSLLNALQSELPVLKAPPAPRKPEPPKPKPEPITQVTVTQVGEGEVKPESEPESDPEQQLLFSAVGIITGDVHFDEETQHYQVTLDDKPYRLVKGYDYPWQCFLKHLEAHGSQNMRLVVYPQTIPFPDRNKPHYIKFQLVKHLTDDSHRLCKDLKDREFFISGIWQHIPVFKLPVCSVHKNKSRQRKQHIKQMPLKTKKHYLKANHIPLFWKKSTIKPYRFNPKKTKEQQGKPKFIQVKAKFNTRTNTWGVIEQCAKPTDPPNHFKWYRKKKSAKKSKAKNKNKATNVDAATTPSEETSTTTPPPAEQNVSESLIQDSPSDLPVGEKPALSPEQPSK